MSDSNSIQLIPQSTLNPFPNDFQYIQWSKKSKNPRLNKVSNSRPSKEIWGKMFQTYFLQIDPINPKLNMY